MKEKKNETVVKREKINHEPDLDQYYVGVLMSWLEVQNLILDF